MNNHPNRNGSLSNSKDNKMRSDVSPENIDPREKSLADVTALALGQTDKSESKMIQAKINDDAELKAWFHEVDAASNLIRRASVISLPERNPELLAMIENELGRIADGVNGKVDGGEIDNGESDEADSKVEIAKSKLNKSAIGHDKHGLRRAMTWFAGIAACIVLTCIAFFSMSPERRQQLSQVFGTSEAVDGQAAQNLGNSSGSFEPASGDAETGEDETAQEVDEAVESEKVLESLQQAEMESRSLPATESFGSNSAQPSYKPGSADLDETKRRQFQAATKDSNVEVDSQGATRSDSSEELMESQIRDKDVLKFDLNKNDSIATGNDGKSEATVLGRTYSIQPNESKAAENSPADPQNRFFGQADAPSFSKNDGPELVDALDKKVTKGLQKERFEGVADGGGGGFNNNAIPGSRGLGRGGRGGVNGMEDEADRRDLGGDGDIGLGIVDDGIAFLEPYEGKQTATDFDSSSGEGIFEDGREYGFGDNESKSEKSESEKNNGEKSDDDDYRYRRSRSQKLGEVYEQLPENRFKRPIGEHARSTFSIDVDSASYSNIRRMINNGQRPDPAAVRIEEMVNYFKYDYPEPEGNDPFFANMELAECPWNSEHQLLRIGIKAKDIHRAERPNSNLVFLVDVSGSMSDEDKLPLLKRGLQMMMDRMSENDRISIVTYAGEAGIALEPTSGDQKTVIRDAIEKLNSGGSTNGSAGITMAYDLAERNFQEVGVNRVILATDGDLNVGITGDDALVQLIKGKAESNVFLSVFGFGTGNLKDAKLEKLADNGNGLYAYIDSTREAHRVLVEQMSGSLVTVAKDLKMQLEFNPAEVKAYRLIGYENRVMANEDFHNAKKDGGDIGAGHTVTALYEIVPANAQETIIGAGREPIKLKYQQAVVRAKPEVDTEFELSDDSKSGELLTLFLNYKKPESNELESDQEFVLAAGPKSFESASGDFKFASSVAAFGMVLRNSRYAGSTSLEMIERIAASNLGDDQSGFRAEFVDLVRAMKLRQGQR